MAQVRVRACKGCGAELFEAQRFCRSCGRPTDELPGENAPTQRMPPEFDGWSARASADTAPSSSPYTSPVTDAPYFQQQAPLAPAFQPPPFVPPRPRAPLGLILAFVGAAVFAMIIVAVMFVARRARNFRDGMRTTAVAHANETPLAPENADKVTVSGSEEAFTKTFTLFPDARVSLKNVTGGISVTSWDKPLAEITAIKRGSESDRRSSQVFVSNEQGNLSIRTVPGRRSDVRFEIKLPRDVGRLELATVNGGISVADIEGEIVVESVNGSLDLINVTGLSRAKTINGSINAVLGGLQDRAVSLFCTNGNVNVQMPSDVNGNLDASATHGAIFIDDSLGIQVDRQLIGQKASGKIGEGGQDISIRVTNGSIKITKQKTTE